MISPDPHREEGIPGTSETFRISNDQDFGYSAIPSDAELAARDAELAARDAELAARDAELAARDAIIKSILLNLSLK